MSAPAELPDEMPPTFESDMQYIQAIAESEMEAMEALQSGPYAGSVPAAAGAMHAAPARFVDASDVSSVSDSEDEVKPTVESSAVRAQLDALLAAEPSSEDEDPGYALPEPEGKLTEADGPVQKCGTVHAIVDSLVVISTEGDDVIEGALDIGSQVALVDGTLLGSVFDTFGSVDAPYYVVLPGKGLQVAPGDVLYTNAKLATRLTPQEILAIQSAAPEALEDGESDSSSSDSDGAAQEPKRLTNGGKGDKGKGRKGAAKGSTKGSSKGSTKGATKGGKDAGAPSMWPSAMGPGAPGMHPQFGMPPHAFAGAMPHPMAHPGMPPPHGMPPHAMHGVPHTGMQGVDPAMHGMMHGMPYPPPGVPPGVPPGTHPQWPEGQQFGHVPAPGHPGPGGPPPYR